MKLLKVAFWIAIGAGACWYFKENMMPDEKPAPTPQPEPESSQFAGENSLMGGEPIYGFEGDKNNPSEYIGGYQSNPVPFNAPDIYGGGHGGLN